MAGGRGLSEIAPRARLVATAAAAAAVLGLLVLAGLGLRALASVAAGLDHRLVDDAAASRSATLTTAAHLASLLGRSWVLFPVTGVLALALARRLRWRALGPLAAVAGADLLQQSLKALVQRPRPGVLHLEHVTGSSFPSGHATESAAVAVALVLLARGRARRDRIAAAIIAAVLVAAVGASRVYLGVHYPTDVAAGIVLGSAWGATAAWLTAERRDRKLPLEEEEATRAGRYVG